MKKLSLVVVTLLASFALSFAQDKEAKGDKSEKLPYNRWEIGINAGVANFAGSSSMSSNNLFKRF